MTHQLNTRRRVPDLLLERYRLGEMTPDEMSALERRLRDDGELQQRLQALETSDREIHRSGAPAVLAARVRRRLEARPTEARHDFGAGFFASRWRAAAALGGVLALAVIVGPLLFRSIEKPAIRIKGLEPALLLFRKTAEGSEPLLDGAVARPGDLIRIGYRPAGCEWGLILSVDGRGVISQHLPREGGRAARLSAESQVLLDFAYELDDAPLWERFYFIAASEPFDAAPILDAARRVSATEGAGPAPVLPLRMKVKQASVLLIKKVVP